MNIELLAFFSLTAFVTSLIPGPSTLLAFTHGVRLGLARALATAVGNASASILQALAASAGLGIVLTKSAILFMVIKYAGAAYLVYLGVAMWRSDAKAALLEDAQAEEAHTEFRLFRSGFLVAASNPKAIVFFTALFPQFLSPTGTNFYQLALMVALVGIIAFSVAMIYAGLGARMGRMNISRRIMGRIHKFTGGLFVFSGIGLAATRG